MSYTLDGVSAKQALGKNLGDTNTLITPPVDTLQEAQVLTTGIPAEIGHAAGGAYSLTTKSGTNQVHFSAEERYINKDWLHRQAFNQGATDTPFEYHNFNTTLSGPIVIPKIYNGRNRTFFLLGYRLDYDHETNYATVSAPTLDELNGDFSFNGLGQPIYDPKSIVCGAASCANGTGYVATRISRQGDTQEPLRPGGREVPLAESLQHEQSRRRHLLRPDPPMTTFRETSIFPTGRRISERSIRVSTTSRSCSCGISGISTGSSAAGITFSSTGGRSTIRRLAYGLPEPIDERNIAAGYVYTISPTLINEFQVGYQRRNDSIYPATANQGWAGILGNSGRRAADVSGTGRLRQQFVQLDRQPGRRLPHDQRGRDPGG